MMVPICFLERERQDIHSAIPRWDRISKINDLYIKGHEIIYHTARGMGTFDNDRGKLTRNITTSP